MESFKDIINSSTPTVVDFFATWCGPCKMMAPILDDLKEEFQGQVRILKIDVDKNQSAAAKFQIRGVPTFILFKNGEIVWRMSGGMSKQEFAAKIRPHI